MSTKNHDLTEAQLAALVGPRTREVSDAFQRQGPMTVPELQSVLRLDSKALYYQVRKLVKVGLLTESDDDPVVYSPIAERLRMPSGYQGARYERLAAKSVEAGVRRVIRKFHAAAELAPEQPELVDNLYYLTATLRLTNERRAAFQTELRSLLSRFTEGEGEPVVAVFIHAPRLD